MVFLWGYMRPQPSLSQNLSYSPGCLPLRSRQDGYFPVIVAQYDRPVSAAAAAAAAASMHQLV